MKKLNYSLILITIVISACSKGPSKRDLLINEYGWKLNKTEFWDKGKWKSADIHPDYACQLDDTTLFEANGRHTVFPGDFACMSGYAIILKVTSKWTLKGDEITYEIASRKTGEIFTTKDRIIELDEKHMLLERVFDENKDLKIRKYYQPY